jgi:hypothetical protein
VSWDLAAGCDERRQRERVELTYQPFSELHQDAEGEGGCRSLRMPITIVTTDRVPTVTSDLSFRKLRSRWSRPKKSFGMLVLEQAESQSALP